MRGIAIGLGITLGLVGCEGGLRLAAPQPTYSRLESMVEAFWTPSPTCSFTLQKNYRGTMASQERPGERVLATTNEDGLRGPALDQSRDKILIIGDSTTFGLYVSDRDPYPAVLQQLMGDRHEQVVNAGYAAGFESDQQYCWLLNTGIKLKPRVVVLGFYLANDIRGIAEQFWRDTDGRGLLRRYEHAGYHVTEDGRMRATQPSDQATAAEKIYAVPYLRESHAAVLAWMGAVDLWSIAKSGTWARNADNKDLFGFIYGDYSPWFLGNERLALKVIGGMRDLVEAQGGKFVVELIPASFTVDPEKAKYFLRGTEYENREPTYYAHLEEELDALGIAHVNIERAMVESGERSSFFPPNGEVHMNENGHRFTAQVLFKWLSEHGYLTVE